MLTFPLALLRRYVRDMLRHSVESVRCPLGVSRQAGSYELLAAAPGSAVERVLLLSRTDTLAVPRLLPVDYAGVLFLGDGP